MNEMKSDDPWFIARDGAQHGPLNETEMKLFVERGHLRATDLIWRQGFPDWRPAFSVFPPKSQPTQPPAPTSMQRSPVLSGPTAGPALGAHPAPVRDQPFGASSHSTGAAPLEQQTGLATINSEDDDFYDDGDDGYAKPRWGRAVASLVVGTIAGLGLWVYVNGTPAFFDQAALTSNPVPVVKAPEVADATKKPVTETAATTPRRINIDNRLQNAELWQFLKSQYPAWYGNVLENANKLDQSDNFERKLSELLVSRLIELRRRNAEKVLASSSQSLTTVASTFLSNLKYLANRGPEPCFTFISKGEASPAVVEAMRKPGDSAPIHGQLLATFKASVEGAKAPVTRTAPQKSDYEALTGQLAKIGWNKEDIQLFANPQALSQAPPARVCQMVQDWFTAHLNLENAETQERLLYETLRPVVSG